MNIDYAVRVTEDPEGFTLAGPTGDTEHIDGSDLDEAKEIAEDYPDWSLEETVVLLFGSWVCKYPDNLSVFNESVENERKGLWTLTLSY